MKKMSVEAKKAANGGYSPWSEIAHCNVCDGAVLNAGWARSVHDSVCHPGQSSWTIKYLW